MKKSLSTLLFILITCVIVKAQNTATSTVTAKIPDAMQLTVSAGASVDFDFTSNISSLTTGIEKLNAVSLSYVSNKPWYLNINAATNNFSGGDQANPMPASILQFKNNASGAYAPLSATPVSLSGTTGAKNAKGSSTVGVDLKMTPGFTYAPASDYSISITYTISNI